MSSVSVYQLTDLYAQLVYCSVHLGNQIKFGSQVREANGKGLKLRDIAWESLVLGAKTQNVSWRIDNTEMNI